MNFWKKKTAKTDKNINLNEVEKEITALSQINDIPYGVPEGPKFSQFGKISRLNREIVITEKIDGTNAAIGITDSGEVYAQSRNRIIRPGDDNYGFAGWVEKNAKLLSALGPGLHFGEWWGVGIGRNYDLTERRFSLFNTKRWLDDEAGKDIVTRLHEVFHLPIYTVPVLYTGPWHLLAGYKDPKTDQWLDLTKEDWDLENKYNPRNRFAPDFIIEWLKRVGSFAVEGYMKPEGIVVYHKASQGLFKVTVEKDSEYKGENRVKDSAEV